MASPRFSPKPMTTPPPGPRGSGRMTVAVLALSASMLAAQTTPPSVPAPETDENIITLDDFRVDGTNDVGYRASNSISGTRLNTPIKDLPLPISAITLEFIEDIGAVDFKEALVYEAGIIQDELQGSNSFLFSPSGSGQGGQIRSDNATVNIRGFNTRSQLRNGFRLDTITDNINVGRIEVARGPQALLYGVAVLGGVVNIIPDYPSNQPGYQTRVSVGSDSYLRGELEATGPLFQIGENSVNFRLGGAYTEWDADANFQGDDRTRSFLAGTIDFKPFAGTQILLDAELARATRTGFGFIDVEDSNSATERIVNAFGENTANTIYGTRPRVLEDWYFQVDPTLDRGLRLSGDDTFQETQYKSGTVEVTQKLLDRTTLIVGYNYQRTDIHGRQIQSPAVQYFANANPATLPNSGANTPRNLWTSMGGNVYNHDAITRDYTGVARYRAISYNWTETTQDIDLQQIRVELNHQFDLLGGTHSIMGGYQNIRWEQLQTSTAMVRNNLGDLTGNSYKAFFDATPITYQGEVVRPFRDNVQQEWNMGFYGVYQGRFADDRVTLIGGLRRDRYMVRDLNYTYVKADSTLADDVLENWVLPAGPDGGGNSAPGAVPTVDGYRFGGEVQYKNSPTLGVNIALTPQVSIYALGATGLFPNRGQRDGFGEAMPAEETESREVGLKFDLWKNKEGQPILSGAAALFKVDRTGGVYNIFWAPQPRSNNRQRAQSGVPGVFQDFESSQPVSYLLPVAYINQLPADDLASARIQTALAGQRNNFVLVDYASLGSDAADPLRRAMNLARNDPTNLFALQQRNTGNTAADLFANHPYINRNSDVAYDDQSKGYELSMIFTPTKNFVSVMGYTRLKQAVTGGFQVVDHPNSTEYDTWWNLMGISIEQARALNFDESAADLLVSAIGKRTIDNPDHQVTMWNKYTFTDGPLQGFDLGLGFIWSSARQGGIELDNGLRDRRTLTNQRFNPDLPARWVFNAGFGYKWTMLGTDWNARLNVNNILDDNYEEVISMDNVINGNPAPSRSVAYYQPRSWRLSVGVRF